VHSENPSQSATDGLLAFEDGAERDAVSTALVGELQVFVLQAAGDEGGIAPSGAGYRIHISPLASFCDG